MRVFYVHWNESESMQRAAALRARGHTGCGVDAVLRSLAQR